MAGNNDAIQSARKAIPCFQSRDIRATLLFYVDGLGFKGNSQTVNKADAATAGPGDADAETGTGDSPGAATAAIEAVPSDGSAGPGAETDAGSTAAKHRQPQPRPEPPLSRGQTTPAQTQNNEQAVEQEPDFCSIAAGPHAAANFYFFKLKPGEAFQRSWALVALENLAKLGELYDRVAVFGGGGRGNGGGNTSGRTQESGDAVRIEVVEEIGDQPWGYRQFSVQDPDGNKVTFFAFLEQADG